MSLDDETDDEDIQTEVQSLPFLINEMLFSQYGAEFSVARDDNGMYIVTPKNWKIAPFKDTRFSVSS